MVKYGKYQLPTLQSDEASDSQLPRNQSPELAQLNYLSWIQQQFYLMEDRYLFDADEYFDSFFYVSDGHFSRRTNQRMFWRASQISKQNTQRAQELIQVLELDLKLLPLKADVTEPEWEKSYRLKKINKNLWQATVYHYKHFYQNINSKTVSLYWCKVIQDRSQSSLFWELIGLKKGKYKGSRQPLKIKNYIQIKMILNR